MAKLINVEVVLLAFEELLIGLGGGLGAAVVGILLASVAGLGLFESGLYVSLGAIMGALLGIGRVGYKYLQETNRTERFAGQVVMGLAGLALGAAVVYCSLVWLDTTAPAPVAMIILSLPVVGLLIGFNHRIGYRPDAA